MEIVRTQGGAKIARNRRCCGTQAQPDAPRRLGLVLGGGGGKGGAHLGVLAVLVVGLGTYFSHRFVERSRVTTSASTKA